LWRRRRKLEPVVSQISIAVLLFWAISNCFLQYTFIVDFAFYTFYVLGMMMDFLIGRYILSIAYKLCLSTGYYTILVSHMNLKLCRHTIIVCTNIFIFERCFYTYCNVRQYTCDWAFSNIWFVRHTIRL